MQYSSPLAQLNASPSDQLNLHMTDCTDTLYNDLREVLHHLGSYPTHLYNLIGLLQLPPNARVKIDNLLSRHRILENFLHRLLQEVWKFKDQLENGPAAHDPGMALLHESRLHGFFQDTCILQDGLERFESEYQAFMEEMASPVSN